jgi:hypothetical protein
MSQTRQDPLKRIALLEAALRRIYDMANSTEDVHHKIGYIEGTAAEILGLPDPIYERAMARRAQEAPVPSPHPFQEDPPITS